MAWSKRFENIRQRDWPDLLTHWAEAGIGFDTADAFSSSIEDTLEPNLRPSGVSKNDIVYLELEDRKPILSDLVFAQIKANNALLNALGRIESGNASWGVADAYHSSMLLMKAILAALGIFICRIHNRPVLIDAFPWVGRIDVQKKFKRDHRNWKQLVGLITCTSDEFSQSDLFELFQRVLNVSTVPTNLWPEVVVRNIIKTHKKHFSALRNKLIYNSRFWFFTDDLLAECLSMDWISGPKRNFAIYNFEKLDPTAIDCFCDCWVFYLMGRKIHEAIYATCSDSLQVFDYIDSRRASSEAGLIEQQFENVL